ncbi:MFS transporter [Sphingobium indicum]|uniref:MFS transporter n=1 Tax=Sphingobium indicum TaxID=332055 RepID=UPI0002E4F7D8|nr:MFS transporter [Sphingobium indicum]NYI23202.1 MFS family permease [Sphingobium indicum]
MPRPLHPSPRPSTDGGWPPVLALAAITLLVQGGTLMSLGVLLPGMAADFGQAGGGITIFLLAMSLASLTVGWALGKAGVRPVLLIGILLSAAGFALAAMAQQRPVLMAGMALSGLGVGASTIVPGIAVITRHHVARRGLALAIFLGAAVAAGAVVPPLVGAAMTCWTWRAAMLLCAAAIMLACPPLVLIVPGGRADVAPEPAAGRDAPWRALGSGNFRRILLAMTLLQLAINGVLFAAVDCLMTQGLGQSGAVLAYSSANLVGLPALLAGGMLADRIGARRSLIATALLLAAGTMALLGAGMMGMAGVWLFVLLWGVASALPGQSGSMLLADVVKEEAFARLLGLNTAVVSLLGALAPLWTDQMRAAGGGYGLPISVYAALALAAAPLIASVRPSKADAG